MEAVRPAPQRPRGPWPALLMDGGWTLALAVFSLFGTRGANEIRGGHPPLDPLGWVLAVAAPLCLIAVRRRPREVFAVITVLCAVYLARDYAGGPIWLALIVAAAVIGWALPLRTSLSFIAAGAVVEVAVGALHPDSSDRVTAFLLCLTWALVPVVPWALTALARTSRSSARQAEAGRAQHEADTERVRIAREVHDVVGHSLAVISMQAGVALHVADSRPEQTRPALEAIARSSKDALEELRRTLAVLRGDGPAVAGPGLGGIPALVEDFTAGGARIRLRLDAGADPLPPDLGAAVYRVVQESLTNTVRHARGAVTQVRVGRTGDRLTVDVVNDGPTVTAPPSGRGASGSGLGGMAARCTGLGGTFEAGPRDGGGWRVHAELPVDTSTQGAQEVTA